GAPAGTTVLAEEQVSGRGRVGRSWSSPPGLGLWVSMVSRPRLLAEPGLLPLVVGLEVARALDAFAAPDMVCIKWPNDLILGGRKVGGILCEAAWSGGAPSFLVVGVGINVRHAPADFPEDLRGAATSLRGMAGYSPAVLDVASRLVPRLYECLRNPAEMSARAFTELTERDSLRGRRVTVSDPSTSAPLGQGTAAGIARDGALLLREGTGEPRPFRTGTVRVSNELHP
ncbi:MAG: biotin--[acetyl-CoA-carboxylase] ligase, partial [Gemmatimonadetes bacterium]|nr:biotin--[acetyl-CoA-carboxylase] ligase [Gemmatimonadota bacterium]